MVLTTLVPNAFVFKEPTRGENEMGVDKWLWEAISSPLPADLNSSRLVFCLPNGPSSLLAGFQIVLVSP